jgi:E3 ubiquitin-protein ligase HUWE1
MDRLLPGGSPSDTAAVSALLQQPPISPASGTSVDSGSGVTSAMEQLTTESSDSFMDTGAVITQSAIVDTVGADSTPAASSSSASKRSAATNNPQLQGQIKQIKPLLSGSSRLGRALAELFGLLVKLCVGSPLRQRRGQQVPPAPVMPSPPARAVATALAKLLTSGLSWEPPATSPLPKFRLTFLICSVGFTSPMLFDEKKYPYHLMLMKFLACGGQQAFFRAFYWAITLGHTVDAEVGLESPDMPEGTGEFLDAWLLLLEKMVNPRHVLESPHLLPAKASANFRPFDALRYLIKTHKTAFEAVMHIWGKRPLPVYGSRMAESVLTILCHILKGEVIIKERLEKERPPSAEEQKRDGVVEPVASAASAGPVVGAGVPEAGAVGSSVDQTWAASTPAEPDINPEHLQTLMDMGFPRERCVEAMQMVGGNLDAATDYLLNNPLPSLLLQQQQSLGGAGGSSNNSFVGQDDLMRAIAMSLGENVMVSTDGNGSSTTAGGAATSETSGESSLEAVADADDLLPTGEQEALKQQVIDTFTSSALSGCLTLLDTLPETVYRVTDLLMAMFQRNGPAFKETLLADLMAEVHKAVVELLAIAHGAAGNTAANLATCVESRRAAVRIHLFTLLFEDCSRLCVRLVENTDTMQVIQVLHE